MIKRSKSMVAVLVTFVMLALLLGACSPDAQDDAVVNVPPDAVGQEQDVVEEDVVDEEIVLDAEDAEDLTVITDTELITGTEITTDVTVMTDTVVLEEQLITTVITATDIVTDVTETTDSTTTTASEVIIDSTELTPQTDSAAVEADVEVTVLTPTPVPTVVVQVTRVVTEVEVFTNTVKATPVAPPRPAQTPQAQAEIDAVAVIAFIGIEGSTGKSMRASTLLDSEFETVDGQVGGEIQDLVIDMQTGQVLYVLLEYGGVLDVGDTDMPVPLRAFTWGTNDELVLNVEGTLLEEFPGVSNDWPVAGDSKWDTDVRNFWSGIGIETDFDTQESAERIRRASDLLDDPLADVGYGDGTVEDLVIALDEGRVTYVLVSLPGLGEEWYVLPFNVFDPSPPDNAFIFVADFDATLLEQAPRFNAGEFDQTRVFDLGYDDEWHNYWNDAGYPVRMADGE